MTPARRTFGIVVLGAAVAVGAFFLTRGRAAPTGGTAADAGVLLRVQHESSHVLWGTNETHLAVTVTAPRGETQARPDMNLSIVLDRSGSMSGEKLEQAKAAARQLVTMLDQRDRFSVVVYGSEVDVVFPAALATARSKSTAIAAIDQIRDDGGTNIGAGLTAGRAQVLSADRRSAVARIVLISDGKATDGMVHPDELAALAEATAAQGISITTVGIGLDFDERMMTRLAVAGRGNYYFAESAGMLARMFEDELGRLGATIATNAQLTVVPGAGVEVLEAYGYPMHAMGSEMVVPIADLHAGETRKVVLRLRVTANQSGAIDLASVRLAFIETATSNGHELATSARAEVTRDHTQVRTGWNREAMGHIVRARTAYAIEEATVLYEQGDYSAAQALLDDDAQTASDIAAELKAPDLDKEIGRVSQKAKRNFAAAPKATGSPEGKKASKDNRNDAYILAH